MNRYTVNDLQGASLMSYSFEKPLTALEIRQIRWEDYKDNMQDDESPLKWSEFTLDFIADLWEIEFVSVRVQHGQWVCPNYNNASALPDEKDNCSLCGAEMVAGYPEQEGND